MATRWTIPKLIWGFIRSHEYRLHSSINSLELKCLGHRPFSNIQWTQFILDRLRHTNHWLYLSTIYRTIYDMTILNCFSRSNDRFGNAGLASNAGVMQRSIKLNSHILWRPFEADLDCVRDASANSSFPIIDVQVWYVPKWAFIDDVYVCWIGLLFCVIDSQRYDDYVRNANVTISFDFCDNTGEKWFAAFSLWIHSRTYNIGFREPLTHASADSFGKNCAFGDRDAFPISIRTFFRDSSRHSTIMMTHPSPMLTTVKIDSHSMQYIN